MKWFAATLSIVLFLPGLAWADVRISEIAWMGVAGANGQYGEWVELQNTGTTDVDLAGWKLYTENGGQLLFTLTKRIPAGGFLLVERTTASMPDPVPGVNDESGTFGGGGLSNSGEDIVLKESSGAVIQILSFAGGWPAGDATTKDTMQWNGTSWVTAAPTPKNALSSSDTDGGGPPPSAPAGTSKDSRAARTDPFIDLHVPEQIYTDIEYSFSANVQLEYSAAYSGIYEWNMGDGTFIAQDKNNEEVKHVYHYPGTYVISFAYYRNVYDTTPLFQKTSTIDVGRVPVKLSLPSPNVVEIENTSKNQVDISNWIIRASSGSAALPPFTFLAPGARVSFSFPTLGIVPGDHVRLTSPLGISLVDMEKKGSVSSTELLPVVLHSSAVASPLAASVSAASSDDTAAALPLPVSTPKQNHTKNIFFGAALLVVIGLSILLERFMARKE